MLRSFEEVAQSYFALFQVTEKTLNESSLRFSNKQHFSKVQKNCRDSEFQTNLPEVSQKYPRALKNVNESLNRRGK